MTVVHEYLFQNKKGELVLPTKGAVLKGRVYRDMRFYTGQIIKTSKVKGFHKNIAVTKSSHYELGSPAKEYIEFSKKISEGISVITKWSLSGSKEKGYTISGKTQEGKKICKKVLKQEDSCLTLDDGNEYFVQWRAMSKKTKRELDQTGTILDLEQGKGNFEFFSFVACKPIFFPEA